MQIDWKISSTDIQQVKDFIASQKRNPLVQRRERRNLAADKKKLRKKDVWKEMVGCLLTTQQRSGPGSNVHRFLYTKPFPLSFETCISKHDIEEFSFKTLSAFGGIRRTNSIAKELSGNLTLLEDGLWADLLSYLDQLRVKAHPVLEKRIAVFIDEKLRGFGPKQSRNLLQGLGLTRYEIPIDSRITKWLNKFGFPVELTASALGDRNYYQFVSDGIQNFAVPVVYIPAY